MPASTQPASHGSTPDNTDTDTDTDTGWDTATPTSGIELINLTGHAIVLVGSHRHLRIPACGQVARIHHRAVHITGYHNGVPVLIEQNPKVMGLPASRRGTAFIVSRLVLDVASDRSDLLCPGHLVRDEDGGVIAAEALITNSPTPVRQRVGGRSAGVPARCRLAPDLMSSVSRHPTTPRTASASGTTAAS